MEPIHKYFNGESFQCQVGIGVALVCMLMAAAFIWTGKPILKGMAYPFILIPLGLLIICTTIVMRTPKDLQRVTTFYQSAPEKLKTEELPRMEKVMAGFKTLKRIEIVVGGIGLLLFLLLWNKPFWSGVGLGLFGQGIIMLCFDIIAEARGKIYLEFLQTV